MWSGLRREVQERAVRTTLFVLGAVTVAFAVMAVLDPRPVPADGGRLVLNPEAGKCGGAVCDGTCILIGEQRECLHDTPTWLAIQDNAEGTQEVLVVCTGPAVRPTRCWAAPGVVMTQHPWWLDDAYVPPERDSILWGAP